MTAWTSEHVTLIRSQLERVAASPAFANAGRMAMLLRYLVDADLNGGARRLNQTNIAIDVFQRDDHFDPAVDSIVRVEMGRLRNKLREFYTTTGTGDPVVFALPKGSYRPTVDIKLETRSAPPPAVPKQELRFCVTADGTTIAYATSGSGYPLVKAANWLSHLEYDYQSPVWRHWWNGLSERFRLIRYDERGCGLSDWDAADVSFDAWVQDLEQVVDTAAPKRFALFGMSQGVPVAIAYAAKHPERVSHLILYGGLLRGALAQDDQERIERVNVLRQLLKIGWGERNRAFRQVFAALFFPEGTDEQFKWFHDLQEASTCAANAVRYFDVFTRMDASRDAARVRAPTLVLHAESDALIPFSEARAIAASIPGARLVPLKSKNHVILEHEPAWSQFLEEVSEFINDPRAARAD